MAQGEGRHRQGAHPRRTEREGLRCFPRLGRPGLYDSTLRILEAIAAEGVEPFEYEAIPGISSIQLLAARHKIPSNAIGEPVLLTTGRKIAEAFPHGHDSVVVLQRELALLPLQLDNILYLDFE